jgi:hypothetical protein
MFNEINRKLEASETIAVIEFVVEEVSWSDVFTEVGGSPDNILFRENVEQFIEDEIDALDIPGDGRQVVAAAQKQGKIEYLDEVVSSDTNLPYIFIPPLKKK